MKLCSFVVGDQHSIGLLGSSGIIDIGRRLKETSLRNLIASQKLKEIEQFADAPADYSVEQITFLPVIPDSGRIFCLGLNYADHIKEVQLSGLKRERTRHPPIFLRLDSSLVGHQQPIIKPAVSSKLDFEGELVAVIGRAGRYIDRDKALEYVAGYSCFNDCSARDWQSHTSQVLPGKNFPFTGAYGPWLVTADAVPDPQSLSIETRVNGAVMQRASTADMIFSVAEAISYLSYMQELRPGDVIATGTPSGVGQGRSPQVFLNDGDTCVVEIERVGCLINTVIAEKNGPADYTVGSPW